MPVTPRFLGLFWMSARIGESCVAIPPTPTILNAIPIGERLSPYVALACIAMAVTLLIQ